VVPQILFFVMLAETALVGAAFLLYPRIVRKGLLFGVYVGEGVFEGEAARRLTRRWNQAMWAALGASIMLGAWLAFAANPLAVVAPLIVLVVAFLALYLWAYSRARALAPAGPPPPAVAALHPTPPASPLLPALAIAVGVAAGAFAIGYAWAHYGELPERIPVHFGLTGEPDAWRSKSPRTVLMMPVLILVMGVGLGGLTWLTAHAKRALRRADAGASLAAQLRFRTAMTRFLCVLALLTDAMLLALFLASMRVSLGAAPRLGTWQMALTGALMAWALGGSIYLMVRYGQGGSRLERASSSTPLTNGLADNRHWVLGLFYVNRDDPSILVEQRFGLGYTINFGNPKAVALLAVFLAAIVGVTVIAALT